MRKQDPDQEVTAHREGARPGPSIARSAGVVSLATMISRVLGVMREMVMARYFGSGIFTDAFNVAYRIPNLLRDLFAEGALSAAFVPTFTRIMRQQGSPKAWQLANLVINSLAIGALIGGASQFFVQVPSAHGLGFRYQFIFDFADPALRHIGRLMLPAVIGLSATQINITVDNQLASRYGDGPVSWLNYAFRLMQLPIGVFGISVATATLATVSHHAAQNAMGKLRETVASSLRLAACLTFPASVGLIVFREEIVRLLYERGRFLPGDTYQTSRVLLLYGLALFAYSAVKILVPTFYALNDTRTPVRTSMITVAVKVALNFLRSVPLQFLGLALSTAVASWMNFFLLLRQLGRRTGWKW